MITDCLRRMTAIHQAWSVEARVFIREAGSFLQMNNSLLLSTHLCEHNIVVFLDSISVSARALL